MSYSHQIRWLSIVRKNYPKNPNFLYFIFFLMDLCRVQIPQDHNSIILKGDKMERQDMFNKIRAIDGKCNDIRNNFGYIENALNTLHYKNDEKVTEMYSEYPYIFVFDLFIRINEEFDFGLEEVYNSYLSNETIKVENLQKMYLTLYKLLSNEYKNLLAERETLLELI